MIQADGTGIGRLWRIDVSRIGELFINIKEDSKTSLFLVIMLFWCYWMLLVLRILRCYSLCSWWLQAFPNGFSRSHFGMFPDSHWTSLTKSFSMCQVLFRPTRVAWLFYHCHCCLEAGVVAHIKCTCCLLDYDENNHWTCTGTHCFLFTATTWFDLWYMLEASWSDLGLSRLNNISKLRLQ